MRASRNEGFSLIEVMVALSMAALVLAISFPSWEDSTQKRMVTGSAEQLAAFLSDSQSSAIKHNDELTVSLMHNGPADWCVGAVLGNAACNCTVTDPANPAFCAIDGAPQILDQGDQGLALMTAHSADTSFTYEPVRGLMASADLGASHSFDLQSTNSAFSLQVSVLPTGRIRICSNDSSRMVPGYKPC